MPGGQLPYMLSQSGPMEGQWLGLPLERNVPVPAAQECSRHRGLPGTGCGDDRE